MIENLKILEAWGTAWEGRFTLEGQSEQSEENFKGRGTKLRGGINQNTSSKYTEHHTLPGIVPDVWTTSATKTEIHGTYMLAKGTDKR